MLCKQWLRLLLIAALTITAQGDDAPDKSTLEELLSQLAFQSPLQGATLHQSFGKLGDEDQKKAAKKLAEIIQHRYARPHQKQNAILALGYLTTNAESALPVLVDALRRTTGSDENLNYAASATLGRLDQTARPVARSLLGSRLSGSILAQWSDLPKDVYDSAMFYLQQKNDPDAQTKAVKALRAAKSRAGSTIDQLLPLAERTSPSVHSALGATLAELLPHAPDRQTAVLQLLQSSDRSLQKVGIIAAAGANPEAQLIRDLVLLVQKRRDLREAGIKTLGTFSARGQTQATSYLKKMMLNANSDAQVTALFELETLPQTDQQQVGEKLLAQLAQEKDSFRASAMVGRLRSIMTPSLASSARQQQRNAPTSNQRYFDSALGPDHLSEIAKLRLSNEAAQAFSSQPGESSKTLTILDVAPTSSYFKNFLAEVYRQRDSENWSFRLSTNSAIVEAARSLLLSGNPEDVLHALHFFKNSRYPDPRISKVVTQVYLSLDPRASGSSRLMDLALDTLQRHPVDPESARVLAEILLNPPHPHLYRLKKLWKRRPYKNSEFGLVTAVNSALMQLYAQEPEQRRNVMAFFQSLQAPNEPAAFPLDLKTTREMDQWILSSSQKDPKDTANLLLIQARTGVIQPATLQAVLSQKGSVSSWSPEEAEAIRVGYETIRPDLNDFEQKQWQALINDRTRKKGANSSDLIPKDEDLCRSICALVDHTIAALKTTDLKTFSTFADAELQSRRSLGYFQNLAIHSLQVQFLLEASPACPQAAPEAEKWVYEILNLQQDPGNDACEPTPILEAESWVQTINESLKAPVSEQGPTPGYARLYRFLVLDHVAQSSSFASGIREHALQQQQKLIAPMLSDLQEFPLRDSVNGSIYGEYFTAANLIALRKLEAPIILKRKQEFEAREAGSRYAADDGIRSLRSRAGRSVTGAGVFFWDGPKKQKKLSLALENLMKDEHINDLILHSGGTGAHSGQDGLAPYYLYSNLIYASAFTRLMQGQKDTVQIRDQLASVVHGLIQEDGHALLSNRPPDPAYSDASLGLAILPLVDRCNVDGKAVQLNSRGILGN